MTKTVRSKLLLGAMLAGGFLVSAPSFAQPDRGPDRGSDRGAERGYQYQGQSQPPRDARRGPGDDRDNGRAGPGQWHKGDRLPAEYRDRQYVVDDWHSYDLPKPSKGHHWVGVGGDFYLVAPNGAIVDMGGRR